MRHRRRKAQIQSQNTDRDIFTTTHHAKRRVLTFRLRTYVTPLRCPLSYYRKKGFTNARQWSIDTRKIEKSISLVFLESLKCDIRFGVSYSFCRPYYKITLCMQKYSGHEVGVFIYLLLLLRQSSTLRACGAIASYAGVFRGARISSLLVGRDEIRAPLKTPAWEASGATTF